MMQVWEDNYLHAHIQRYCGTLIKYSNFIFPITYLYRYRYLTSDNILIYLHTILEIFWQVIVLYLKNFHRSESADK